MNDVEKLAELDRKLVELKSALADRVERLTERAAAPLDALEEGLLPALKHGEASLRETVTKYPLGSVAAAIAAGAATTVAIRRAAERPESSKMLRDLEPYWAVAGEALRSLGIAAASGVVEGALRVLDARQHRGRAGTARGNLAVVATAEPPAAGPNDGPVARPL
jgi:hypothetical protein